MRKLMSALLVGATVLGVSVPVAAASSPLVSIQAYGSTITVFGHGFGHGRGMGQYGAFGYATNFGWNYHQILDHYYGGSTAKVLDPASLTPMTVRLVGEDDGDTILVSDANKLSLVSPISPGPFTALLIRPRTDGTYDVYSSTSCGGTNGSWGNPILQAVAGPVRVTTPNALVDKPTVQDLIGVCEPAGSVRYYRGDVEAIRDGNGAARTVDVVPLESYVRGVVPRESPASWGDAAGGKGMAALQAQAVAARSYGDAHMPYLPSGYAKICDTSACQVYGGAFLKANPATLAVALEDPRSDNAVLTTVGEVRTIDGANAASTEFSSSTGGYTAGGTFPSVIDDGDTVAVNPNHNWTTTVPRTLIESVYPSIGTLLVIQVKSRNGVGDLGGRVKNLILEGTKGSATITSWEFVNAANSDGHYRVLSDWFQVVSSALTSPAAAVANGPNNTFYVATTDGGVLPFNGAQYEGSMLGTPLNKPIVSMTANATGTGYWLLGGDGGVFAFNVPFRGSTGGMRLVAPVLALAARPQGDGYWFVASDGGVFAYGAPFLGSMGGQRLNQPVVGMAPTPSGNGYWLVASDGGIFSFGDAAFYGSTGGIVLSKPVVGIAVTKTGHGYWLVAADGGVFSFGDAAFFGSAVGQLKTNALAISSTSTGLGYRIVGSDGTIVNFGDAS